ncbi:hypothetical protein PIB30_070803 [Stylosanthes scabra]|uniref:Uncharacterized protein n=1 Tax=Stylosanthes scabra TaxID=79078 RepID=A0ABU6ZM80_9FABA|nr:hypothetical protein [Stylosanthes scabra]
MGGTELISMLLTLRPCQQPRPAAVVYAQDIRIGVNFATLWENNLNPVLGIFKLGCTFMTFSTKFGTAILTRPRASVHTLHHLPSLPTFSSSIVDNDDDCILTSSFRCKRLPYDLNILAPESDDAATGRDLVADELCVTPLRL